ncbi:MAG: sugar phosphate nucleotidyltransferase [Methanomicrobiales archaeon]
MIKTIVMAGGKGTRLRPLTFIRPKPMIPLVNKPIMQYMVERLRSYGFNNMIITLSYMSSHIKRYFKDGSHMNLNIKYSVEPWPMGTGGGVKKVRNFVDDTFFVISGDVITDVNFNKLLEFHKKKGAIATMVLTHVDDPSHFGIAEMNEENKIVNYLEKPSPERVFSNIANTGTYIFEPEIFNFLDRKRGEVDFSKHIFPELIKENAGLYGYIFDGYWNDVGRPETYLKATYDLLDQEIKQKLHGKIIKEEIGRLGDIWVGENVKIGPKVRIEGPVLIGNNCILEEGCRISQGTVMGDNVCIKKNAYIQGAVVLSNSVIGEDAFLDGCIIDSRCKIEDNAIIEKGAVIGSFSEIGSYCIIKSSRCIANNVRLANNSVVDYDYLMGTD